MWIMAAGLIGAALFYGDGVITPAISVLSAVEGLKVATPIFEPYVVPISLVLLIGLFLVQRRGTAAVGRLFGPIMVVWFVVLALLGLCEHRAAAADPVGARSRARHRLLARRAVAGFVMLGAVFLAVTGAETLYADMGHFGRNPLRRAWLYFVLPALLLNYYGQGALLLARPERAAKTRSTASSPGWGLYPLVVARLDGDDHRLAGRHLRRVFDHPPGDPARLPAAAAGAATPRSRRSARSTCRAINTGLLAAIVILVLGFQTSDSLGAAYGIAVTGMMVITSGLAFIYMRSIGWSLAACRPACSVSSWRSISFSSAPIC